MTTPGPLDCAIRPCRAADRDALADLWVEAWNATLPQIDFAARRPWIVGLLGQPALVAAVAAVPVAAVAGPTGGERPVGFITLERQGSHIEQLAVLPACHGRGVAGGLCAWAMALSPGFLTLAVNQDNPRAVRFYQRLGFRIEAEGVNPGGRLKIWTMRWRRDGWPDGGGLGDDWRGDSGGPVP